MIKVSGTMGLWQRNWFKAVLLCVAVLISLPAWSQKSSHEQDLIGRAREAYNERHFHEAAELYKDYLDKYPNGEHRDEAGFFHAHSLFLTGENEKAGQAFAKEESRNSSYHDQVLYYQGQLAARKQDYNRALVFYDRLVAEHPDSRMRFKAAGRAAEVHYRVGNRYLAENAVGMALQHYSQAAEGPDDLKPLVLYKLGLCYQKRGKPERAIEVWGDLGLQESGKAVHAARVARYRLARLLEDRGRLMQAEVNFESLIEASPDHFLAPPARQGLARVWARQGKKEKAIEFWKKEGKAKEIMDASSLFNEALHHYLYEQYGDAVNKLRRAFAAADDKDLAFSAKLWLARTYKARGNVSAAEKAWEESFQNYDQARDYNRLEFARFLLEHDPPRARSFASELTNKSGAVAEDALAITAHAAFAVHDKGALSAADRYFLEYPEGEHAGEIALLRGRELFKRGETEKAIKDLQRALDEHPSPQGRLEAARLLSRIYELQGRKSSAGEVLRSVRQDALSILSETERLRAREAETEYSRGEYKPGVETYEEICARKGGCPPETRFRLFFGRYRNGSTVEAGKALEEVEKGGPGWKFQAGLWRGIMLKEQGRLDECRRVLEELDAPDPVSEGLLLWELSRVEVESGSLQAAMNTLSSLDKKAPAAGIYVKGEVLRLALESGDFETYLATLPDPSDMDRATLSEEALLGSIRSSERSNDPDISAIKEYLAALRVVSLHQESVEEGTFWLAKARLKTGKRDKALDIMSELLSRNPSTPYAEEMKFYHGEDAFLRKDYQGAVSWLKSVRPEDLPDKEKRFRLLYLKGQSHKKLQDLESMRPYFLALVRDYSDLPGHFRELLNAGTGLVLTREFSAARTALDIVIQHSSSPSLKAEALYWKGMGEQGSGNLDSALSTFLSIPEKYPGQDMWVTTALYEAGHIHTQKGEYDQALDLYRRVLARTSGDKKTSAKVKAKIAEVKKLKRQESDSILPSLP
ncbi:MAG: tetratricopeptide repeat protein [bacterium]